MGVLALLTRTVHVWYLAASISATQIAILSNFALAEWLVFRGAHTDKSLRFRFASYLLISDTSLLIRDHCCSCSYPRSEWTSSSQMCCRSRCSFSLALPSPIPTSGAISRLAPISP
jgi:hypothetical protein